MPAPIHHDASRSRSRSRFLSIALVATVVAPLALTDRSAYAATPATTKLLPKLPLTDLAAKALACTQNATAVKHFAFKPGSTCANCNLYKGAKGQAFGACTIFPKNTVAAKGW